MKRRVLIACEESQAVCIEFRKLGFEAFSCDIQECSGGHPEWHITGDVLGYLNDEWDLMIAHPPCKFLAWSGERWLTNNPERQQKRKDGFDFLKLLYHAPIPRICIENSLSLFLQRTWKKPTQTIHPFHFGDPFRKSTCLWLKNLKPLMPTNVIYQREPAVHNMWPGPDRDKLRAKTYPGIAKAMAEQWGKILEKESRYDIAI